MLRTALVFRGAEPGPLVETLRPSGIPPPSRARVRGAHLAYDTSGASRVPLVLVHGYMGSRLDFLDVRTALAERRRVLLFDQRGHGESTWAGPYTVARLMRDLEDLLEALGEGPVDLLGHSMGGMVALRLAVARPARIRSLVLMNSTAGPFQLDHVPPEPDKVPLASKLKRQALALLGRDEAATVARGLHASPATRRRFEEIVRFGHRRVDPAAARELAIDLGRMPSVEDALHRYDRPALVLVGEKDQEFLESSKALAGGLPRSRLVVVPGAGHYPHFEAREAWLAAVESHLASVTSA